MIYDKIENLCNYTSIPHAKEIADFIASHDLKNMECGSFDICDGVRFNFSEYEPGNGGDFEAHREYSDLQYAITGGEYIDVIPTADGLDATDYKPDILFFKDKKCLETRVALNEGTFAYLSPDDAHKPCINSGSELIRKAVVKIRIN